VSRLGPASAWGVARPDSVGIVHIGVGAFHRAHQAVYTAEAGGWGILGVAPRRPDAVEALVPQDGLYSVLERGADGDRATVYGALRDVVLGAADTERVVAAIASPSVHVVSLTVTEAAYAPGSAVIEWVARGIERRARAGEAGPLTVLSCDNLPRNGEVLARLVGDACGEREWLDRHVRFPSSMVDRVVPATTEADLRDVARLLGVEDRAAVVAEPFRQWVIEDAFAGPRPAWEHAGALLVADSGPHETLKLRLLNGTHSLLAYVGLACGARTVAQAWGDASLSSAADALASEDLVPTLPATPGIDVGAYRAQLAERFANPRMVHTLEQIAADGSQKLPLRFAEAARSRLAAGAEPRWIALVLAAWAEHLREGASVHDAGADRVRRAVAAAPDAPSRAAAVLDVMGEPLASSNVLSGLVVEWLERIDADGMAGALRAA
jgi:fructuronate reductase